jgi:hypothetical protein
MKLPFRRSTTQNIETSIAALCKRGEQLAAKRTSAQQALETATKARQHALLTGDLNDDTTIQNLQGTLDSTASALAGIDDAIIALTQQKLDAEGQLAAERGRVERARVSEEIRVAVTSIESRAAPVLSAMREIATALTALDHLSFEMGQLGCHLSGVAGEAEIAFAFVLPDVRRFADAVKDGNAAIAPRPKAAEPVPTPEPAPPTMTVFMLRSARYCDDDGRRRFAGQYEDVLMPVPAAQRALRHGLAVSVVDPRRAQLRGVRGGDFEPNAPDVVDLDDEEASPPHIVPIMASDPLASFDFRVIDRSAETRTLKIEVPRL